MLLSPIYGGFSKKGLEANKNVGKTVDMLAYIFCPKIQLEVSRGFFSN